MKIFYVNDILTLQNYLDFLLRIVLSMVCGGLIGYERERRLKNAGLRTHIIVALAASLMMIVSKYGFMDIVGLEGLRLQTDGSRIASAVVQAIGFIGAGVIYIKRENAVGLTTAAGLWATVGIGLAIGAGLYSVGIISTLLILLIQLMLHAFHSRSHTQNVGTVKSNLTKHGITFDQFWAYLDSINATVREIKLSKENNETVVTVDVLFKQSATLLEVTKLLNDSPIIDSTEIFPVF